MRIADSMKGITEGIITSYDLRVKALGNIVADTRKTLEGFASDRKKMGEELAKNLTDFVKGLSKSVEDMLKRFQKDHKQMSDDQAKSLADFVKDLTKHVGDTMTSIQKAHKEMADNLKERLEKGEADRLKDFKDMMGDITKGIKEIENYVADKLKEFHDTHADMSKELKTDLDRYVASIVSETKKLMKSYEGERKKMAANWQSMAATMAKKRGIKPKVEAEVKVRPVEEAIKEAVEEEEAPPEMDLEEKVLKFIERHPEGVKVSDMEASLGVARTRLGVIAKKLFEEDKVRKEGSIYFPL
jgi:gas vesicle protein